ncbi:HSP-70 cofactor [Streptococcus pneumoniae]|nr:HSP-70 cofactor [Streptococcus pneumoniae]
MAQDIKNEEVEEVQEEEVVETAEETTPEKSELDLAKGLGKSNLTIS